CQRRPNRRVPSLVGGPIREDEIWFYLHTANLRSLGPLKNLGAHMDPSKNMRSIIFGGICTTSMNAFFADPFLAAFAHALGASHWELGLISAVAFFEHAYAARWTLCSRSVEATARLALTRPSGAIKNLSCLSRPLSDRSARYNRGFFIKHKRKLTTL